MEGSSSTYTLGSDLRICAKSPIGARQEHLCMRKRTRVSADLTGNYLNCNDKTNQDLIRDDSTQDLSPMSRKILTVARNQYSDSRMSLTVLNTELDNPFN